LYLLGLENTYTETLKKTENTDFYSKRWQLRMRKITNYFTVYSAFFGARPESAKRERGNPCTKKEVWLSSYSSYRNSVFDFSYRTLSEECEEKFMGLWRNYGDPIAISGEGSSSDFRFRSIRPSSPIVIPADIRLHTLRIPHG
jgi:hypothetical protein